MKYTIITVTYNAEDTIEKTIESVIKQDYYDYEYLIIDGESQDQTLNRIENLRKKYNAQIQVYSEKDEGIYNAMNKGIEKAKGDFIIFLNSGDLLYDKTTLTCMTKKIKNRGTGIYCGNTCMMKNGKPLGVYRFKENNHSILNGLLHYKMPCHQSIVAPTSILKKYKFNEIYKLRADYDWLMKCYRKGIKFFLLDDIISAYDIEGASTNLQAQFTMKTESEKIVSCYFPLYWILSQAVNLQTVIDWFGRREHH